MNRRGFSVVELLIIIVVMGILLTLAVVNLRSSQINGRDAERKADIESIMSHLETFYTTGTDGSIEVGRYPSTAIIGNETTLLRDIDTNSLMAPGIDTISNTFKASDNTGVIVQTTAAVSPQPTIDQYVYQPIKRDGTLCTTETDECRSYNLYYMLEIDNEVHMEKSKNR